MNSVRLNSKELGTKRFISRRGVDVNLEVTYWVTEEAPIGATKLQLHDSAGLLAGAKLYFKGERLTQTLTIKSADVGEAVLERPLEEAIPGDSLLHATSDVKALFTSPGRDITRDTIEANRRVRLPADTLISYGSILQFGVNRYFVSGYQAGDSSLSIGLKIINEYIDIYGPDSKFNLEETDDDDDDITGWLTPAKEVNREWPEHPRLIPIHQKIEAYQEQQSLYSKREEPGYIPSLNRFFLIPAWIPVEIDQYIVTRDGAMRILGRDLTRIRNMQALYVDYNRGLDVEEAT